MSTIVTRAGKGSPLTNNEVDSNFTNLNTDKVESITSADGSVVVSSSGTTRDLSVGVAGSTATLISQVRNETGATLTKGTVVYISGAAGNKAVVSKALATSDSTSAQTYGMVQADIAHNHNGYVVVVGAVSGLNTSAFTDGTQLYLSSVSAGGYTNTKPYAPSHLVYVGIVTYSHNTQGTIQVKIQNGYEMDELHDVSARSPVNGQTLVWNSTTSLWEKSNAPILSGATIDASPIGASTASTGAFTTLNTSGIVTMTGRNEVYGVPTNAGTIAGFMGGTSGGTTAARTQTLSGQTTLNIAAIGYTGTGWVGGAGLSFVATENQAAATRGTKAVLSAIAAGDSTATTMEWNGSTLTLNGSTALTSSNYNNYAPTKTGTGASGTWAINITGNAATVTSITSNQVTTALGFTPYNATNPAGYISSYTETSTLANVTGRGNTTTTRIGVTTSSPLDFAANGNTGTWLGGIQDSTTGWSLSNAVIGIKSDNTTYAAIGIGTSNGLLYFGRTTASGVGTMSSWLEVNGGGVANFPRARPQHNGTNLATVSELSGYLPLGGGTLSGRLITTASAESDSYSGAIRISPSSTQQWGGVAFPDTNAGTSSANNYWFYGRGAAIADRTLTAHIPAYTDYSSTGAIPSWGVYRTGAVSLFRVWADGSVTVGGNTVLNASNYNSYSPTLGGTGASGTWGISISGNSATTSQRAFSSDISASGQGRFTGWYTGNAATGTAAEIGMSSGQGYIFVYNRDTSSYGILNIAASAANMQFSGSTINVSSGALQQGGNQVLHASNYTSYSPSLGGSGASGTWNISITGSAASASTASLATAATRLQYNDGPRDLSDRLPNTFTRTVVFDFVGAGTGNGSGNYAGVMTYSPWTGTTASTGDSSYQLAFANQTGVNASGQPKLSIRNGIDSTWNAWHVLLHSGNYSSYALPLSGGMMAGPIGHVRGSHKYFERSSGVAVGGMGWHTDDVFYVAGHPVYGPNAGNNVKIYGFGGALGFGNNTYGDVFSMSSSGQFQVARRLGVATIQGVTGGSGSDGQMVIDSASGQYLYLNHYNGGIVVAEGGHRVLNANNYNSYSPTLTGGNASGTWGISITGNSATVAGLTPAKFFNNMGNNHSTYTDFNNVPGFGAYYVQQGGNSPTGTGSHQWYGFTLGLGNDYALSEYGTQLYWPRAAQNSETYMYVRDREGGSWGSWRKTRAGYSDSAGSISGFNNPTTAATANTIAYRDSGGDIYQRYSFAVHFNQSGGNSENPTIGQIWTNSTSDNYVRKSTPAHFISQLGLLTTGNYSSYALPLSGGTLSGNVTLNTAEGEILVTPTGWRSSDRAAIKIRSKANTPAEIDLRHTVGGVESGWHISARDTSASSELHLYRYNMNSSGAADSSSFLQMFTFHPSGAFNASGSITQNGNQVLHAGNYSTYSPSYGYFDDYTRGGYRVIADYAGSNTWYIRSSGQFVWGRGHDWTQAFELYIGNGSAASNNGWAEFGQRQSNNAAGTWFGTRFVQYTGSAKVDGYVRAGRYYLGDDTNYLTGGGSGAIRSQTPSGYIDIGAMNGSYAHIYTDRPSFYLNAQIDVNGNRVLNAGNYTSYSHSISTSDSRYSRKDTTSQWIKPYYEYGNSLTSETPSTLRDQMGGGGLRVDFMNPSYTGSGNWNHVITWSGYNVYNMYQLGGHYDGGTGTDLWVRSEANHGGISWTAWRRLLNSSNYNSYSPTLTGGNASGTWSISISGRGYPRRSDGGDLNFYWAGQGGQPPWLWGGSDGANMYVYNPSNFSVSYASTCGTASRASRANGNMYIDDNYGNGIVGAYASTRYQGVFFMGDSYKMSADGTSLSNMYGIGWSHPNAGGAAGNLTDHGMLIINNGGFRCAISNSIVASGNITAYSDERLKTNWRDMPEDYVTRLAQVKVGIYDRIDEKEMAQVGVSAQSFQKLLPQAIMTAKDEMQTLSVNYGSAALASAVELAKRVVDQEKRIAHLESLISKLIGD
jgi:hypothetical protein